MRKKNQREYSWIDLGIILKMYGFQRYNTWIGNVLSENIEL